MSLPTGQQVTAIQEIQTTERRLWEPIDEGAISWVSVGAPVTGKSGQAVCKFSPYVNQSFYEARLDAVVSMDGWLPKFIDEQRWVQGKDGEELQVLSFCKLGIRLCRIPEIWTWKEGVGSHQAADPSDAVHGARKYAFRDACKRHGIFGRCFEDWQTGWVEVELDGKRIKSISKALTLDMLEFTGSQKLLPPGVRRAMPLPAMPPRQGLPGNVGTSDAKEPTRGQEQQAPQNRPEPDSPAVLAVTFPFGKKFAGKPLGELNSNYLLWCLDNLDVCNGDSPKFDIWWRTAIEYAFDARQEGKEH